MVLPMPVRVIGVGSPHADDALGWEVVRRLRKRGGLSEVELFEVDGGQRLLDHLDGRGTLILIDALTGGGSPGTIWRFEWPDARLDRMAPASTHALSPAAALELACALGLLPPRVVIHGLEIASSQPGDPLSAVAAAAVPRLALRIEEEVLSRPAEVS
jgi:hydrogenase maturation protease